MITNYGYGAHNLPETIVTGTLQNLQYFFNATTGNLNKRTNNTATINHSIEYFSDYDNLNRLRCYNVIQNAGQVAGGLPITVSYDDNGNISSKTDAGGYVYGSSRPHAVTDVLNNTGAIPTATQSMLPSYTPFNKIASISENNKNLSVTYGPDQQRIKTELKEISSNTILKTKYFTADYEEELTAAGTRKLHYISGSTGLAAIYIIDASGTGQMYYVLKDHLGSITGLVDEVGVLAEEYSYDPWGRRRNATTGEYPLNVANPTYLIDRGFTGHEHLDEFGLINMNGRLYDPVLGRMLSPDNYVQDATSTQAFNRYSYAMNNPLKFTDPTGDFAFIPFLIAVGYGALIGAATSAAVYSATAGSSWNWNSFGTAVGVGALGGALGGGIGYAATSLGAFGHSLAFNVLNNVASNSATTLAFGGKVTAGSLIGSALGGVVGAGIGNFRGVGGGALKNMVQNLLLEQEKELLRVWLVVV